MSTDIIIKDVDTSPQVWINKYETSPSRIKEIWKKVSALEVDQGKNVFYFKRDILLKSKWFLDVSIAIQGVLVQGDNNCRM